MPPRADRFSPEWCHSGYSTLLANITMFLVSHHHVRRQTGAKVPTSRAVPHAEGCPVRETDRNPAGKFCRSAGAGCRPGVGPHTTGMLVEAHRPVGDDFLFGSAYSCASCSNWSFGTPSFRRFFPAYIQQRRLCNLQSHRFGGVRTRILRCFFQRMGRRKP